MTYQLTSSIPAPEQRRYTKYPLHTMEVGESFYCEPKGEHPRSSLAAVTKRTGRKFRSRREGEGWRVWRVA